MQRPGRCKTVQSRITRLRVFNFVKGFIELNRRWPTENEVCDALGLGLGTGWRHMQALEGAAGLPGRKRHVPKRLAPAEMSDAQAEKAVEREVPDLCEMLGVEG